MNNQEYIEDEIERRFLALKEEFGDKILSAEIVQSRMVNKINALEKRIQLIDDLIVAVSQLSGLNRS